MSAIDLNALLSKLHPQARRALEESVANAVSRTHFNVEIEHWLQRMIEDGAGDISAILRAYDVDVGQVSAALNKAVDGLKTGNARTPGLSPQIIEAAREAWNLASLRYGAGQVRTGHVLLAVLERDTLSATVLGSVPPLKGISVEALAKTLPEIIAGSSEDQPTGATGVGGGSAVSSGGAPKGGALDQFTIDLTQRARDGAIDPVLGRDQEIRQIIDILTRRRQNNPILTGEAGVGKTAVVEGFALRVAAGDVPPSIKPCVVRTLDLGLLQAGAGMRGEFENRLKSVIEEVKASTQPIILFIDEAHTLIGAGGSAGQGDAANLLKPALARGELRTIAATTWAEYKKYFERDAALARRFQVVKVEEPSESVAVLMMRGLVDTLEQHHGVRILDEAVVESVRLSHRYITGRQLPDKSVSLLDTACARVSLSQHATPPQVEDLRRRIENLDTAIKIAEREAQVDSARTSDVTELQAERAQTEADLGDLDGRWKQELALVNEIRSLRGHLEAAHGTDRTTGGAGSTPETEASVLPAGDGDGDAALPPVSEEQVASWRAELEAKSEELRAIQGEDPLLQAVVDGQAIASIVGAWTGIPVGRMVSNEIHTILSLKDEMGKRILGQDTALEVVSEAVMSGRARLSDPRKPLAVFMLVGTSGVGKTETALSLAELLYGGEQNMTIINMSEFKEEHKVSLLMGSPPGYVGYGEGGVLTEAVRRKPYSVVLLDEMEKAHPGVQDIFYQVFDKGMLKDGEGRDIDFKNTVIIMTSNAGTDTIHALCDDPETMPDADGLYDALRPELLKVFKPAFLGRLTVVPYFPLPTEIIKGIVRLQVGRVKDRVRDAYKADLEVEEGVIDLIATRATEVESGARVIDRILTRNVLPDLAARILTRMANGEPVTRASLRVGEGDTILCSVEA